MNKDRSEQHSTDHLKERGGRKAKAVVPSSLVGMTVFKHTTIGTVLRATLGRLHIQALQVVQS